MNNTGTVHTLVPWFDAKRAGLKIYLPIYDCVFCVLTFNFFRNPYPYPSDGF